MVRDRVGRGSIVGRFVRRPGGGRSAWKLLDSHSIERVSLQTIDRRRADFDLFPACFDRNLFQSGKNSLVITTLVVAPVIPITAVLAVMTPSMAPAKFLAFHPAQHAEYPAQRDILPIGMIVTVMIDDLGLRFCGLMGRGGQGGQQAQSGRGGDDELLDGHIPSPLGLAVNSGLDYGLWSLKRF